MRKITATAAALILLAIAAAPASAAESSTKKKSHFDNAVELYTQGPSKADEVLREIDLALAENPGNSGAYVLKAVTLMGTKRCPKALKVVDELEKAPGLKGKVFPLALEVRARCLCAAGKYAEAKAALEPFRKHFYQKEEWREHYDTMMQAIEEVLRSETGR
jgi:hypothetical protein